MLAPMSEPSDSIRLFDYGSLMAGERDHALMAAATALGPARTKAAYHLVDLGFYPALISDGNVSVVGELYLIDRKSCFHVDVKKECPVLFVRSRVELADGTQADAYFMREDQVRGRRRLKGGDWRARFAPASTPKLRSAFVEALRRR